MVAGRRGRVQPTYPEATAAGLTRQARIEMAPRLLDDLFLQTRRHLLVWAAITGQSAQVDSGYIAQHLVSLVTGIPGVWRRGKGLQLSGNDGACQSDVLLPNDHVTRPIVSARKWGAPRTVLARPSRRRAIRTSPVPAATARRGW